jgi:hypothetical protein
MKLSIFSLGLISISALLPLTPSFTTSASACAQTAVGVQVRVSGEKNPQAGQKFGANQTSDDNCFNNNVTSVGKQISVGSQAPEQDLEFNQHVGGGNINQTGVTTPNVKTQVPVQVDVYSPAHDPEFMNRMMQGTKR